MGVRVLLSPLRLVVLFAIHRWHSKYTLCTYSFVKEAMKHTYNAMLSRRLRQQWKYQQPSPSLLWGISSPTLEPPAQAFFIQQCQLPWEYVSYMLNDITYPHPVNRQHYYHEVLIHLQRSILFMEIISRLPYETLRSNMEKVFFWANGKTDATLLRYIAQRRARMLVVLRDMLFVITRHRQQNHRRSMAKWDGGVRCGLCLLALGFERVIGYSTSLWSWAGVFFHSRILFLVSVGECGVECGYTFLIFAWGAR